MSRLRVRFRVATQLGRRVFEEGEEAHLPLGLAYRLLAAGKAWPVMSEPRRLADLVPKDFRDPEVRRAARRPPRAKRVRFIEEFTMAERAFQAGEEAELPAVLADRLERAGIVVPAAARG